jgi:hypothetical protein
MMFIGTFFFHKSQFKSRGRIMQKMTGPELVSAFNEIADKIGVPKVKRFATLEAGTRRLEEVKKKMNGKSHSPDDKTLLAAFKARPGTKREKLIKRLLQDVGKPVPITQLLVAVFGRSSKELRGPLMMNMNGVKAMIIKHKLPCTIVKTRGNKENNFALHVKNE